MAEWRCIQMLEIRDCRPLAMATWLGHPTWLAKSWVFLSITSPAVVFQPMVVAAAN